MKKILYIIFLFLSLKSFSQEVKFTTNTSFSYLYFNNGYYFPINSREFNLTLPVYPQANSIYIGYVIIVNNCNSFNVSSISLNGEQGQQFNVDVDSVYSFNIKGSTPCNNGVVEGILLYYIYNSPLPVDFLYLLRENEYLEWATASEANVNYFLLEGSEDCLSFKELLTVLGSGNSSTKRVYKIRVFTSFSYIRLSEVDFDGEHTILSLIYNPQNKEEAIKFFNLLGQEINTPDFQVVK
jgi:hypothetical protein